VPLPSGRSDELIERCAGRPPQLLKDGGSLAVRARLGSNEFGFEGGLWHAVVSFAERLLAAPTTRSPDDARSSGAAATYRLRSSNSTNAPIARTVQLFGGS
jgi:hypothetical protein